MNRLHLAQVDTARAVDWVRGSFARGSVLSGLVAGRLHEMPASLVIADPGEGDLRLDDHSHAISSEEADEVLQQALGAVAHYSNWILVVEDDLARRGDARLEADGNVLFAENRVLRWADPAAAPELATRLLREGASGYPLNAFLCRLNAETLGLRAGQSLGAEQLAALARSAAVVITSIYDAESYLLLATTDLAGALSHACPARSEVEGD